MFAGLEGAKKEGGVKDRPRKAGVDECGADKVVWLLVVNRLFMRGVFCRMDVSCKWNASL